MPKLKPDLRRELIYKIQWAALQIQHLDGFIRVTEPEFRQGLIDELNAWQRSILEAKAKLAELTH